MRRGAGGGGGRAAEHAASIQDLPTTAWSADVAGHAGCYKGTQGTPNLDPGCPQTWIQGTPNLDPFISSST